MAEVPVEAVGAAAESGGAVMVEVTAAEESAERMAVDVVAEATEVVAWVAVKVGAEAILVGGTVGLSGAVKEELLLLHN